MTDLRRALALPEWAGIEHAAGPDQALERTVREVGVLADARGEVPADARGRLLVVAGGDAEPWRLDVLLRRTAAAGGHAVLVPASLRPGRASALVARRLGVAVLTAPDPLGAAVALRVHLALPELARARWVEAAAGACASAAPGVAPVVLRCAAVLARDLWLLDAAGRIVVGPPDVPSPVPTGVGADPSRVARWLEQPDADHPDLVTLTVPTDHPRGAYVALRRRSDDEPGAVRAALGVVATTVAGRLALDRLDAERDARHRMGLLSELVRSGGRLSSDGPGRLLAQGWSLTGHHIGLRVDVPSALDPVALRPDVLRAFADGGVTAQVVEQGAGWAAWTTFPEEPTQARLRAHAAAVRRVQWLLRAQLPTSMGVGSLRPGPEGLVRSLGEAGDAARIAATRAASGHLVHVDRLGLGQLLLAWTHTDTFAPAAASLLTPLHDHPELLTTLAAYLDAESSVADTAAVLGVHRNTVSGRVGRAVQLLGVDLDDPEERLAVQLACRSVLSQ